MIRREALPLLGSNQDSSDPESQGAPRIAGLNGRGRVRNTSDAPRNETVAPTKSHTIGELPLFHGLPPSVPVRSSENAADWLDTRFRRASCRRILFHLLSLPTDEFRSMAEIGAALHIPDNLMTARMDDLRWSKRKPDGTRDASGYIEERELCRESTRKPGLRVNGYRLVASKRAVVELARERVRRLEVQP